MNYREHFESLGGLLPVVGNEFVSLAKDEVSRLEDLIGVQLPENYRQFLCEFGGVTFDEILMARPIAPQPRGVSTSGSIILAMLYGSKNHRELYSLIWNCEHFLSALPSGIIPIGDDGGGAKVCMNLNAADFGQVLYWDNRHIAPLDVHQHQRDDGQIQTNLYLIADSFTDLLNCLYVLE